MLSLKRSGIMDDVVVKMESRNDSDVEIDCHDEKKKKKVVLIEYDSASASEEDQWQSDGTVSSEVTRNVTDNGENTVDDDEQSLQTSEMSDDSLSSGVGPLENKSESDENELKVMELNDVDDMMLEEDALIVPQSTELKESEVMSLDEKNAAGEETTASIVNTVDDDEQSLQTSEMSDDSLSSGVGPLENKSESDENELKVMELNDDDDATLEEVALIVPQSTELKESEVMSLDEKNAAGEETRTAIVNLSSPPFAGRVERIDSIDATENGTARKYDCAVVDISSEDEYHNVNNNTVKEPRRIVFSAKNMFSKKCPTVDMTFDSDSDSDSDESARDSSRESLCSDESNLSSDEESCQSVVNLIGGGEVSNCENVLNLDSDNEDCPIDVDSESNSDDNVVEAVEEQVTRLSPTKGSSGECQVNIKREVIASKRRKSTRRAQRCVRYAPPEDIPNHVKKCESPYGLVGWARLGHKEPWWPARIYADGRRAYRTKKRIVMFLCLNTVASVYIADVDYDFKGNITTYVKQKILDDWRFRFKKAVEEGKRMITDKHSLPRHPPHHPRYYICRRVTLQAGDGKTGVVLGYDDDNDRYVLGFDCDERLYCSNAEIRKYIDDSSHDALHSKHKSFGSALKRTFIKKEFPTIKKEKNDDDSDDADFERERYMKRKSDVGLSKNDIAKYDMLTAKSSSGRYPERLVGRSIVKRFEDGDYSGVVTSYDGDYFKVEYTDGDEEELSEEELALYLCSQKKKESPAVKKEKFDDDSDDDDFGHYELVRHKKRKSDVFTSRNKKRKPDLLTAKSSSGRYPEKLVGRSIVKRFEDGDYSGVVTSYDGDYFKVEYTDGDEEELSEEELALYLCSQKKKESPAVKKEKFDDDSDDDDFGHYELVKHKKRKSDVVTSRNKKRKPDLLMTNPSSGCNPEKLIGRSIVKNFEDGDYSGVVTSYDGVYFKVEYTDGDKEELSEEELVQYLSGRVTTKMKQAMQDTPPTWQIAGGSAGKLIGGCRIAVIELENSGNIGGLSFFSEYFSKDRTLVVRQLMNNETAKKKVDAEFEINDIVYHLMGLRVSKEEGYKGIIKNYAEYMYVAVRGNGLNEICLKTALERVADFSSLPNSRKVAKRLELFGSKAVAKCPPCRRHYTEFSIIQETISPVTNESMGDGCGFISDDLIQELLGNRDNRNNLAIQVRVFGPRLGVYKGMLCRKPGISGVQLTASMRKVGPSIICSDDWVSLVVVRTSPSSVSSDLGKVFSGSQPSKSFKQKPLSPMIMKVWEALGVPRRVVFKYEKNRGVNLHNGGFVGLADPTDCIPPGHIFITGAHRNCAGMKFPARVFVTRSPCVRPEDGRILPIVRGKPWDMSDEHWEWLLSLPFGGVIFSTRGNGPPLPMVCAAGDLDGDLYFICWDAEILSYIRPRPQPKLTGAASATGTIVSSNHNYDGDSSTTEKLSVIDICRKLQGGNQGKLVKEGVIRVEPRHKYVDNKSPNWFSELQQYLIANSHVSDQALVGKMYQQMSKIHKESPLGMDDPDAVAFANAYLAAIDRGKHSIDVMLPDHLKARIGLKKCR